MALVDGTQLYSAETDGHTARYHHIQNALPLINHEINYRIDKAISDLKLNFHKTKKCDWDALNDYLGRELRRPLVGQIEEYISFQDHIPKSVVNFAQSIYGNIPAPEDIPLKIGAILKVGFAPQIHHDGLLIGADKFGHFFDEGYYYYALIYNFNQKLEDILELGIFSEKNFYGKLIGGIYSYADLVANYEGYLFWKDMLGVPEKRTTSKYFACEHNGWRRLRPINLADYINEAWDEGMNCNDYRTENFRNGIKSAIKKLEQHYGKRFNCPVYQHRIPAILKRYHHLSRWLINPSILPQ